MSYRNAQVPQQMQDNTNDLPLYFQWHHGTDSRGDALADGGWEAECAKYPGLNLNSSQRAGQARFWQHFGLARSCIDNRRPGARDTLVHRRKRRAGGSPRLRSGGLVAMRVLAWVAEIERPAVLTCTRQRILRPGGRPEGVPQRPVGAGPQGRAGIALGRLT